MKPAHLLVGSQRGGALVELAIAMPMLVTLLIGIADFARAFYVGIELTNAARAGVQWGAQNVGNATDTAGMQNAATKAVNITGLSFPVNTYACQCADRSTAAPSATSPAGNCTDPSAMACPSTGTFRIMTVKMTVSTPFSTISPYIPGIPRPLTLSRTATMRVTE